MTNVSSNSIRIGTQVFEMARQQGSVMSRSAAQQIEHWARLGAAVEASSLTVTQLAALLRSGGALPAGDEKLWAFKRQRQQSDFEQARAGCVEQRQLSWFAGDKASGLRLIDSPY